MADTENPWPELVAAARAEIQRVNDGNTLSAEKVLQQCAVGLRDVLAGQPPDPERREYLAFLLTALEQICEKVPPEKALGLWSPNRPHRVAPLRDLWLFVAVGQELDRLTKRGTENPVTRAVDQIAKRRELGVPTVEKAWKLYGGKRAWQLARDEEPDDGK